MSAPFEESSRWFVFCKDELLLQRAGDTWMVPEGTTCPVALSPWHVPHRVTALDGEVVHAVRIDAPVVDRPDWAMHGLRTTYDLLPFATYQLAGKCAEILYWDATTRFCSVCGAPMKRHTDISKRCSNCGKEVWPQLATAIIVLIRKDDSILLVHPHNIRGDYYGLVAGFVETGETLEECVEREVREETGIEVTNIRYYGSQPWPYPCGMMVGFFADYAGGDLVLQRSEIASGGWFQKNNMPAIPGKMSMARMLIDEWLSNGAD